MCFSPWDRFWNGYCTNVIRSYGLENSLWCLSLGVHVQFHEVNLDWGKCRFLKSSPWVLETRRNTSFSIVKVGECDVQSWKGILRHVDFCYISSSFQWLKCFPWVKKPTTDGWIWHLGHRMWAWIKRSISLLRCYSTEWLLISDLHILYINIRMYIYIYIYVIRTSYFYHDVG